MPELPEVETTLRGILPHIKQQTIEKIIIREHRLRWSIPSDVVDHTVGQTILGVERRGKYILLNMQQGCMIIHLGMSGCLRILLEDRPAEKHDHVDVLFINRTILRFTDPRRFGALLWVEDNPYQHPLLNNLGVEPLTPDFHAEYLLLKAKNKIMSIKAFIMDKKIVTGIGNIYACEALFAAGIYPAAPAKSVSLNAFSRLVKSVQTILRHAIKRGGTTLKDFVNSDGRPGYFANQLQVYGRADQPCVMCHAKLQFMKIGQRSTVYCARCQSNDE